MSTKVLTQGEPTKIILQFMLPVFLGNLFQMLYNFFDAIIVGRYLGIAALGAIGATSSIIYLVLSFIVAATQGFCVILAQKFGARDLRMVRKSFAASIILSSLTAIILTLVFVPAAHPILVFLHTPEPIIDLASSYLFVTFMGISASVFYNFSANTIRALGDSVTPLFFLIFSAILNILFDLLFILKFNWSVVGAASATVLSQGICAVICLCFMFFRYKVLRIRLSDFKVSFDFLMEHLRIGYPMGFQISILTLGKIILQYVLNGFGAVAVIAFTTGMRIDLLFFQVLQALGITMANYTAQNFGAGKISRIKNGAKIAIRFVFIFSLFSIIVLGLFSEQIVSLFMESPHPDVIRLASQYLHTIMLFLFFLGALLVYRNILQGIGSVFAPVISGVMELIVRGVCAIVFAYYFKYTGLCYATPFAWIIGALILYAGFRISLYKHYKKRRLILSRRKLLEV